MLAMVYDNSRKHRVEWRQDADLLQFVADRETFA
jgi:hypothetical protein